MNLKKEIIWRVGLLYVFIFLFTLGIVSKIIYLQFIADEKWEAIATKISSRDYILPANRGEICAEDGRLLACSLPYYEIRMDMIPPALTDKIFYSRVDALAKSLSNFFNDKTKDEYKNLLLNARRKRKRDFRLSYHLVSHRELQSIKSFPILNRGRIRGGLKINKKEIRMKPYNKLVSRTIGYMYESFNGRNVGMVGLEEAYESQLKGIDGVRVKKLIGGRIREVVQKEPKDGNDIITCINIDYQDILQTTLYDQIKKFGADYGCAVLMEVQTGEIKAIANLTYNENLDDYIENYNHAIGESNEPGSTFKLASMISLLEDGYIDLNDTINTGKGITYFYDSKLADTRKGGYGKLTVQQIFEKSSNVGIATLVNKFYKKNPSKYIDRLYDLHLNESLKLKIKGEGKSLIKYPDNKSWSGITLPWMSIGYEVKITPLHTLTLYNAVANNGKMVYPKLVKEIKYHGKVIKKLDKPKVIDSRICSKKTLRDLKIILEGVVERGTAKNIKTHNYKIAGKTGTAMISDKNKGYTEKKYRSSFVGYFPADNPKYSCIVMIVNPDRAKGYYGSLVAAPVFRLIADKIYVADIMLKKEPKKLEENQNIPTSAYITKNDDLHLIYKTLGNKVINNSNSDWSLLTIDEENIELKNRLIKDNKVPNVKGMGLKDAIFLLEKAGLKVNIHGKGKVISQSIDSGSIINGQNQITIKLL